MHIHTNHGKEIDLNFQSAFIYARTQDTTIILVQNLVQAKVLKFMLYVTNIFFIFLQKQKI